MTRQPARGSDHQQASTPAAAVTHASPAAVTPGMEIRWMGDHWIVEAVYSHERWGLYFRCSNAAGRLELISVRGNDGGIEVLAG